MKFFQTTLACAIILSCTIGYQAHGAAATLAQGKEAFEAGDYTTARSRFSAASLREHPESQFYLLMMHDPTGNNLPLFTDIGQYAPPATPASIHKLVWDTYQAAKTTGDERADLITALFNLDRRVASCNQATGLNDLLALAETNKHAQYWLGKLFSVSVANVTPENPPIIAKHIHRSKAYLSDAAIAGHLDAKNQLLNDFGIVIGAHTSCGGCKGCCFECEPTTCGGAGCVGNCTSCVTGCMGVLSQCCRLTKLPLRWTSGITAGLATLFSSVALAVPDNQKQTYIVIATALSAATVLSESFATIAERAQKEAQTEATRTLVVN